MMCDGCLDDQHYSDDRLAAANEGDANVVVRCFPMMIDLFLFFLTRILKEEAIAEKVGEECGTFFTMPEGVPRACLE